MPIHDWTNVNAGTFHHFHQSWIQEIARTLNSSQLPQGFYAMAEHVAGGWGPDVLTLEAPEFGDEYEAADNISSSGVGTTAVAERPPMVAFHVKAEVDIYVRKANKLVIRHSSNDRVIAVIEIVSPGNKSSSHALEKFTEKAADLLDAGIHLLIIDLFPPGTFDPGGLHAAIWQNSSAESLPFNPDKPLTLASYVGGEMLEAYVEPTAIGRALIDMPLFLDPRRYVPVPLEKTYQAAWELVPAVWRKRIAT
jgi:hypothetical protein